MPLNSDLSSPDIHHSSRRCLHYLVYYVPVGDCGCVELDDEAVLLVILSRGFVLDLFFQRRIKIFVSIDINITAFDEKDETFCVALEYLVSGTVKPGSMERE